MNPKETFLIENGWKPVVGGWWQAPVTLTGIPHYWPLEAAYELETTGIGSWAYAAEELFAAHLRAKDIAFMDAAEAERFARTGVRLGVPPNY